MYPKKMDCERWYFIGSILNKSDGNDNLINGTRIRDNALESKFQFFWIPYDCLFVKLKNNKLEKPLSVYDH